MKFNITIKDNETGEILRNIDTNAILAGVCMVNEPCEIAEGELGRMARESFAPFAPQAILIAECEDKELAIATVAVERALTKVWGENPEIHGLAMLMNITSEEQIDLTGDKQGEGVPEANEESFGGAE